MAGLETLLTGGLGDLIKWGANRIWPDEVERETALSKIREAEQAGRLQELNIQLQADVEQIRVNAAEAANSSIFVSGWRPFVGWVCGGAFAYHFIIQPLFLFIFAAGGRRFDLPVFDMGTLSTVLFGILGLGAFRTFEKTKK